MRFLIRVNLPLWGMFLEVTAFKRASKLSILNQRTLQVSGVVFWTLGGSLLDDGRLRQSMKRQLSKMLCRYQPLTIFSRDPESISVRFVVICIVRLQYTKTLTADGAIAPSFHF
jgi:hypothetical protein